MPKMASASQCDPSSTSLQHHIFSSLRISFSRVIALLHGRYSWACRSEHALNQYSVEISIHYALFPLLDSSTCQSFPETQRETMAIKPSLRASPPG